MSHTFADTQGIGIGNVNRNRLCRIFGTQWLFKIRPKLWELLSVSAHRPSLDYVRFSVSVLSAVAYMNCSDGHNYLTSLASLQCFSRSTNPSTHETSILHLYLIVVIRI